MDTKSNEQKSMIRNMYHLKVSSHKILITKGKTVTLINNQVTKVNITSNKTYWHHVSRYDTLRRKQCHFFQKCIGLI